MGAAAGIAIGGSVLGSLLGAGGAIQQGQAQAAQDRANANLAKAQADDALARGGQQAGLLRMRTSQVIGQQKVGYAASGVDTQSGSPLQTMASSRMMGELDVATAKNNAARAAWGYRMQANNYLNDANAAESNSKMAAVGSLLGGAGQAFGYASRTP